MFGLSQGVPEIIAYSGEYYRYKSEGLAGFYAPPTVAIDVSSADGRAVAERAVADAPTAEPDVRHTIERRNAEIKAVNDWTLVEISKLLRQRRT